MPKSDRILIGVLVALVGCSSPPRRATERGALDWTFDGGTASTSPRTELVADPPEMAAPPTNPPPGLASGRAESAAETWISLDRWSRDNRIGTLKQTALAPVPTFALTTSNGVLVVQTKSLRTKWNGVDVHFGFEPRLIDGEPFVHALDLKKNIEPLLGSFRLPNRPGRVVVIDPGHGGINAGAQSAVDQANEKEFTLEWARRLEPLLTAAGWQVFLTRTGDADVPLSGRVAFADQCGADLFISLHFNSAAPNRQQAGLETFCLTPAGMASTLTRGYADEISDVHVNNAFDTENLQYAMRLHRALLQNGMPDRGIRRARFMTVLLGQNRPAVLIEGGYLSNPEEARRIADPAYLQKLAESVAEALTPEPITAPSGGDGAGSDPRSPVPAETQTNHNWQARP